MSEYFLADDSSGALDAAAAFHGVGRRVTVVLALEAWDRVRSETDVVGITTETRNAAPAAAAAAVARVMARGNARGATLVYKKIDSTLRGPVAAEIAALAAALPEARILFTPANPAVGRTVQGGVLLVRGVPVAETEFARDPVNPVRESVIRRLLGAASARVVIADAETEADLSAAVARMAAGDGPWVAVGSGALAKPVAAWRSARANVERRAPDARERKREAGGARPVLFVCGSAHAANRAQAAQVSRELGVRPRLVSIEAPRAAAAAAITDLGRAGAAILQLPARVEGRDQADSGSALASVAEAAGAVIAATEVRRLMITGGETAFVLCQRNGVTALDVRAEIEPGLVGAEAAGIGGERWRLAIKPGGFGSECAWLAAAEWLRQ